MTQIAFIGGGNMARSLIGGLLAKGQPTEQLRVAEPYAAQREALARDFGIAVEADNLQAARGADVIVLAVKPQVMAEVCGGLATLDRRTSSPLYLSIAAGISLSNFARWLGDTAAVVRAMPNTPALIGAGACGLYANAHVSASQRASAEQILGAVGATAWIGDESQMDIVTAVSGSGPAYFFLLMEAMISAGIEQGLDPATAQRLVLQTALGAARMANEGSDPPKLLRERVTSPNGTTQAALEVFEREGLRSSVSKAIARATERGRELAAEFGG
jgi:pyrroline-5-carboxylate reductase